MTGRLTLVEQVGIHEPDPGGLSAYLSKAKIFLTESTDGVNPFTRLEALKSRSVSPFHLMESELRRTWERR